jgi:probable HAF family extracellular repeat protein
MKEHPMRRITSVMVAAACATGLMAAQTPVFAASGLYQVRNLGSLGGTSSEGISINNFGLVSGSSNLPGNQSMHAAAWLNGGAFDLGTLGGANSGITWPVKNDYGVLVGIAETAQVDPLGENWSCSAFFPSATGHVCLGFVWRWGHMQALPTLGGNNGFAAGANNRGLIVGWAENTVHDPTCDPASTQVLQFKPVVWGPDDHDIRPLPLISGDTSGAATAINDQNQIVGISGICDQAVGRYTAIHAVLWQNNTVINLGSLGVPAWNTPMAINQRGVVVGFANAPGGGSAGNFNAHAFIWTSGGGMHDLGTLPGDSTSQALGINDEGLIVGESCNAAGACRAVMWRNGTIVDLNTLVAPGYGDQLVFANDINDAGAITGQSFNATTSVSSAFLALPDSR